MAKAAKAFVLPSDDAAEALPPAPAPQPNESAVETPSAQVPAVAPAGPKAAPSYRVGRRNLSAWIDEKAFRQFKSMSAEEGKTIQDYVIEMVNREFARKGRPQIAK